jgi:hypothetical protein
MGSHASPPPAQHQPATGVTFAQAEPDALSRAIRRRQRLFIQTGDLNSARAYDAIPLAVLRPVILGRSTAEQQQLFLNLFRAELLTVEAPGTSAQPEKSNHKFKDSLIHSARVPCRRKTGSLSMYQTPKLPSSHKICPLFLQKNLELRLLVDTSSLLRSRRLIKIDSIERLVGTQFSHRGL